MDNTFPIPTPNVVLLGDCGSGKSSIVNLIAQKNVAPVGNGPTGATLKSTFYPVSFDGLDFNLYDTAGLDEANGGSVPKQQAMTQLYRLLTSLNTGVNLLILCVQARRFRDSTYKTWRLFHEIICGGNVPIILAITGLELEKPMNQWWLANKGSFQKYGMRPNGVACITATRGNDNYFDGVYKESKTEMQQQMKAWCLDQAYKVPPVELFKKIMEVEYEVRWCGLASPIERKTFRTEAAGFQKLVKRCELSDKEALEWGEALSKE